VPAGPEKSHEKRGPDRTKSFFEARERISPPPGFFAKWPAQESRGVVHERDEDTQCNRRGSAAMKPGRAT